MSKRRKSLLPFLALLVVFVTGALNRQVLFSTGPAAPAALPQSPLTSLAWRPAKGDPQALLDSFLGRLRPSELGWLRVQVRQGMAQEERRVQTESRLLLGPNECARLELTVHHPQGATRILVVSDGATLAHSVTPPRDAAQVKVFRLAAPSQADTRRQALAEQGCVHPWRLIESARPQLKDWALEEASKDDGVRRRITARFDGFLPGLPVPLGVPVKCRLYFAASGWLERVEWLSLARTEELVLEMDFEGTLNQALSEEECGREFSFPAAGMKGAPGGCGRLRRN